MIKQEVYFIEDFELEELFDNILTCTERLTILPQILKHLMIRFTELI